MLTPLTAGLVVAGLLLAFVGAAVSVYAVALTGVLVGAGAGYLAAPNLAGLIAVDGLVLTGARSGRRAVGGFLAYAGLSFAVVAIGGLVGGFAGRFAVGPMYAADAAGIEGTLLLVGATLAGVAVGALFGFVLSRTTLVVSTAFIGAAFVRVAVDHARNAGRGHRANVGRTAAVRRDRARVPRRVRARCALSVRPLQVRLRDETRRPASRRASVDRERTQRQGRRGR